MDRIVDALAVRLAPVFEEYMSGSPRPKGQKGRELVVGEREMAIICYSLRMDKADTCCLNRYVILR